MTTEPTVDTLCTRDPCCHRYDRRGVGAQDFEHVFVLLTKEQMKEHIDRRRALLQDRAGRSYTAIFETFKKGFRVPERLIPGLVNSWEGFVLLNHAACELLRVRVHKELSQKGFSSKLASKIKVVETELEKLQESMDLLASEPFGTFEASLEYIQWPMKLTMRQAFALGFE